MNTEEKIAAVVSALEDIKAQDIVVLDTTSLTSMFERVVIASAESSRQTKALAASVRDRMKELGEQVLGSEGEETGEWVLVDLGDIVVHIMHPTVRAHYNLEELWDARTR
jgi:ribosome-associated protein